jgi:hypothetical protein
MLAQFAWADTVHLRGRGSEINGTVTFSNGVFHIVALFKKGPRDIAIDRDGVSEVRFNDVRDNPENDAPDWMLNLSTESRTAKAEAKTEAKDDVVRFWDAKDKDKSGALEAITSDSISIVGKPNKESFRKAKVRTVILAE